MPVVLSLLNASQCSLNSSHNRSHRAGACSAIRSRLLISARSRARRAPPAARIFCSIDLAHSSASLIGRPVPVLDGSTKIAQQISDRVRLSNGDLRCLRAAAATALSSKTSLRLRPPGTDLVRSRLVVALSKIRYLWNKKSASLGFRQRAANAMHSMFSGVARSGSECKIGP